MNMQEASSRFHICMDKLVFYEENGLLNTQKGSNGETEYSETELQRLGVIHALLRAGFDMEALKRYLDLLDRETTDKDAQIKLLRKQRGILLSDIHDKQQSLDALDYMITELRRQKTT